MTDVMTAVKEQVAQMGAVFNADINDRTRALYARLIDVRLDGIVVSSDMNTATATGASYRTFKEPMFPSCSVIRNLTLHFWRFRRYGSPKHWPTSGVKYRGSCT